MIHHATGPAVDKVTREQAIREVRSHPKVSDSAELDVFESNGHWVAAWYEPTSNWKHAEFPPAEKDEEESAPSPKHDSPEGGGSDAPPAGESDGPDDGPDGDGDSDDGGSDGPPGAEKKDGPPGKGGEDVHLLHELMNIVTQMATALGIEPALGGGMGAGPEEGGPHPGPPAPPHGHGGPPPPPGPGGPGGPGGETIQHTRAMKPGEAPPGTTPIGAPAFASVLPDDHPWKEQVERTASFVVDSEPISDDASLAPVWSELQRVAYGTPFKVKQVTEARDESGHRIARALISRY